MTTVESKVEYPSHIYIHRLTINISYIIHTPFHIIYTKIYTMTLHSSSKVIEPLRDLLGDVLLRLEALEGRVGISSTTTNNSSTTTHHSLSLGSSHNKGTAPRFLFR